MSKYSYKPAYIFTPGAANIGTINFRGQAGFDVRNLFSIINVTTGNTAVYLVGIAGYGAAIDPTGTILTLQQSTASMSATDTLVMVYDEGDDDFNDLMAYATDKSDPDNSTGRGTKGLYIRSPKGEDLALNNWAEQRLTNILLQKLIGDNEDLDAQLAEIINSHN